MVAFDRAGERVGAWLRCMSLVVLGVSLVHCTAMQPIPDEASRAILVLRVEPPSARLYVDGAFRGVVEGWLAGAVPVDAGARRVELRADGYLTQRFDILARAGQQVELRVQMEREFEDE